MSDRKEAARRYYLAHRDEILRKAKEKRVQIMRDPELYTKRMAYEHTPARKAQKREYARLWRQGHKRRVKRYNRASWSRIKFRASNDPDYYAWIRNYWREAGRKYYQKNHPLARAYSPKSRLQIPDYLPYRAGGHLDTRSVFLWNNRIADSLLAGRAYLRMERAKR